MSLPPAVPFPTALMLARAVDDVCDRYETAWRGGAPLKIEALADGWEGEARRALLAELVPLELELRCEAGEGPRVAEYLGRFPDQARLVADAFRMGPDSPNGPDLVTADWAPDSASPVKVGPSESGGPELLGDYELLEELARGGMGIVFKARQRGLDRIVALKTVLSGRFATEAERLRFRREAELAGKLDHPNIVPVHEVADHDGRLYFSMKLIDGGTLASRVKAFAEDPRAAARTLAAVARAVHYANAQGFVHRDLKPANILIDGQGQPYVTDFGLARRIDQNIALTMSGMVLGTAPYMAPEQAAGDRREVTPAADVYGLGAILYELLTTRPPFLAETVMETVVQVLEREPIPPRELRPAVPIELERIALRCLEKSPAERYNSAEEVADHLEQYLRGEAVGGPSPWRAARRWARREPELAARLGGLTLIAAVTHYNHVQPGAGPFPAYWLVQTLLALWAVASVLFQVILRRGAWPSATLYAWAATDIIAFTTVLGVLGPGMDDRLVGYPLLIAASGLWRRPRLVWFATGMSVAGFLALRATLGEGGHPPGGNVIVAALIVTGYVVERQVKRFWAISGYFERFANE